MLSPRACLFLVVLAQSGCYAAHERELSCVSSPPSSPCVRWEPAGEVRLLVEPPGLGGIVELSSVAVSGCEVVAAWYTVTGAPRPDTIAFGTRTLDWTGAPSSEISAHPSLTARSSASATFELAPGAGGLGAIATTTPGGCRFQPLDARGVDRGPPVALSAPNCIGLAASGEGYSMLTSSAEGTTESALLLVDATGGSERSAPLGIVSGRALGSRAVFSDGSFLVYTYREDFATSTYSGWLEHFALDGARIAPEREIGVNGVPVVIAPGPRGAVAAWETAQSGGLPLQTRAIDRDGSPIGPDRDLPATGALYGVFAASTSDGGALVGWLESHFDATPEWRLRVQALGPDGAPRGEPTLVLEGEQATHARWALDPSGERALVVFSVSDEGVHAMPLACVH